MSNKHVIAAAVVALLVGAGAGYWISAARLPQPVAGKTAAPAARKPLFYRSPMNPAITSPVPAKDEMGMDYVPVYADDQQNAAGPAGTVKIDPTVVQDIGVRTAKAERTVLSRHVRTVGLVALNEERVARLHPKYDGWVQQLFVDKTGEKVKKNTMLLSIYSPQVVATEDEYLLALANREKLQQSPFADVREGAASLLHSSRERLQLFDMPAHQLRQLERTRKAIHAVHIHSPFDGVVMNIGAREGARITPDTELYVIADLSRIWVLADLYQDDLPWVHVGDTAKMQVNGIPGRTFSGKVAFIYPYFEAKTRTVKVRLEFDNPDMLLKPEMYANVDILADKQVNAIAVPSEAIVRSGTGAQVFVERAPGKFEPRKVTLGVSSDGQTQILSGLEAGETVVTSSEFLIDSESKLREATAKMMEPKQPAAPAPAAMPNMQGMEIKPPQAAMPDMPAMQEKSAVPQQPAMSNMQHDGSMNMGAKP
ncbi:MAG: efflux RND transporter periplasmic adaptor subunit [Gammaproteobacteria bacterium]|nr:efflux RND transporter periplasmic adaptor subunit [Gammaproteobacteria bacterium]